MAVQEFSNMDEARAYFEGDQFAYKCLGAYIEECADGCATVSMTIDDRHHNAQGFVMGGVIFSIADFALAVACNVGHEPGCSVTHTVNIMSRVKGERLFATARPDKHGRTLGFYTVDVHDELGTHVARMTSTTFHTCG